MGINCMWPQKPLIVQVALHGFSDSSDMLYAFHF